ncbi:MAG: CPBP family intramembrane metalloprotease [Spirochaetes bacterium]|jgi:membrane protease YdiL (CAAX protease family)|nr:CPBP family intramembrane metalloprotease [Spirochaetota bacterium]
MFNWTLALILFAVSLPGIAITVPRSLKQISATIANRLPEGKTLPPMPTLILLQTVQSLVLVAAFTLLGGFFAPRVGLEAPFFSAMAGHGNLVQSLPNPLPVVLLSAGGSLAFMLLYYGLLRPWMDTETADRMDEMRNTLGLGARILYGGIVEEVLTRWGLMSVLLWVFALFLPQIVAVWVAIVVTGVIFGLGHIPSYVGAGCRKSASLFTTQILLNLLAGVIFGYLFRQHGLLAAMLSHMLFHLFWYPVDKARMLRRQRNSTDGGCIAASATLRTHEYESGRLT